MTEPPPHGAEEGFWTPESWRAWSDYADDVEVELKFIEDLTQADNPRETWSFSFGPEYDWDKEWLERSLAELAAADQHSCCGHGNYTLDSRAQRTEWGASGAVYEIVMAVSTGILSTALWEAFKAIANKASERAAVNRLMSTEDAIEHSKRRVQIRRGTGFFTDLEGVSASEEEGVWRVEIRVPDTGELYMVETVTTPSGCPVAMVKRRDVPAGG